MMRKVLFDGVALAFATAVMAQTPAPAPRPPDKGVLRTPMAVTSLAYSKDQFTIAFIDVMADGGKIAMMWEKTMAFVPFKVGS